MNTYSVVIIGGGPAGLFCALNLRNLERKVLVLEKNPLCGRKLIIAGSGQCNLTHDGEISPFLHHYGDNGKFLKPALMNYTNKDLITFFSQHGLLMETEIGGKIFPTTRKGNDILDILLDECTQGGIDIRCNEPVIEVDRKDEGFQVVTKEATYSVHSVVIATGGITYPKTGCTGDGYGFAKHLGHQITQTGPALTGIFIKDYPFSDLSGISFADLQFSLYREGKKIRECIGDLLFTHNGLSGPGILDFSRYVRSGDTLKVSFLPGLDITKVQEILISRIAQAGSRQIKTILTSLDLPERFLRRLLELAKIDLDLPAAQLTKKDRTNLSRLITEYPFVVSDLMGIQEAMVTRGGVSIQEINSKTMESRLVPGLFFAGEVMDIDGDCGGYNLQAAFSTAVQAAGGITEYVRKLP
jgi:hypothetical protein